MAILLLNIANQYLFYFLFTGEEPVAIVEESTDLLDYLQNHSEPLSEIIFRWEKTVSLRALKRKEMSIADYFDRFKALLRPNGYILVLTN